MLPAPARRQVGESERALCLQLSARLLETRACEHTQSILFLHKEQSGAPH